MIKLIIAALTGFSIYVASLMQGYVDKQNELAGAVDPKYADTLSVETDPGKFAEISKIALESARTHAPEFTKDVESLVDQYGSKITITDLEKQVESSTERLDAELIDPLLSYLNQLFGSQSADQADKTVESD